MSEREFVERRTLVHAPVGRDAALTQEVLSRESPPVTTWSRRGRRLGEVARARQQTASERFVKPALRAVEGGPVGGEWATRLTPAVYRLPRDRSETEVRPFSGVGPIDTHRSIRCGSSDR